MVVSRGHLSGQIDLPSSELWDARPFIKWAGGKRQLLHELRRFVPRSYGSYFEPLVGGAALFFEMRPEKAVLGDLNQRLIRTYRGVAYHVDEVIRLLSVWPHDREFFLELRGWDTITRTDAEVAAWFIYLNRTAFNGLYRVNRRNDFNVPFGRYANPRICDAPGLRACSARLRASATIVHEDFEAVVSGAARGDFVYFDPPYIPVSKSSNFSRYTSSSFGPDEHRRLRDVALRLKRRGVYVLLSNSSAPEVFDLYSDGFEISVVSAHRWLNSKGDRRGKVEEVIIR